MHGGLCRPSEHLDEDGVVIDLDVELVAAHRVIHGMVVPQALLRQDDVGVHIWMQLHDGVQKSAVLRILRPDYEMDLPLHSNSQTHGVCSQWHGPAWTDQLSMNCPTAVGYDTQSVSAEAAWWCGQADAREHAGVGGSAPCEARLHSQPGCVPGMHARSWQPAVARRTPVP